MELCISHIPLPSPASLAFRANLAQLVSPLRRVRPRVPFFHLAAHRIPTLWYLYRSLLKESPTKNIHWRIREIFRRERDKTGAKRARKQLLIGYKWLDAFRKAQHDQDAHWQTVLKRYDAFISFKREKSCWIQLARNELKWQEKMANRPILTGTYIRASLLNKPMPRMKPQPAAIHHMIRARALNRLHRQEKIQKLKEQESDLALDAQLERGLMNLTSNRGVPFDPIYADGEGLKEGWILPMWQTRRALNATFQKDNSRVQAPYTPELISMVTEARKERFRNKARERQRERRGEILKTTIKRSRQGPPAHVVSLMTSAQKHRDKVSRSSVSEVGYVGTVKRKMGFKMRSDPSAWLEEEGGTDPVKRADLDKRYVRLLSTQSSRRQSSQRWATAHTATRDKAI